MSTEDFIESLLSVLYTSHGWESPLTMERLHELIAEAREHAERRAGDTRI